MLNIPVRPRILTTYRFAVVGLALFLTFAASAVALSASVVKAVATGDDNTACAILVGGAVDCWGSNVLGAVSGSLTLDNLTPVRVPFSGPASSVSTNGSGAATDICAVVSGGAVECGGGNIDGEDGNGTTTGSPVPVRVTGIATAKTVDTSGSATCALLRNGTIKCWGEEINGDLGNGVNKGLNNKAAVTTPVTVRGIQTARVLSVGGIANCAVLANGTVRCWGDNSFGELGNVSNASYAVTPVTVKGITTATSVSSGGATVCALLANETVRCWGDNPNYMLGDHSTVSQSAVPVTVKGLTGVKQVSVGGEAVCVVVTGGHVKCWGSEAQGALGNGKQEILGISKSPVTVRGITGATQVSVANNWACAVIARGGVKCWGNNTDGNLGNGKTTNSSHPVSVSGLG